MFKKRFKGLLAMALAGSIALTSLPLSASATIDCSVDIYNADGDYSSISNTDIVSDGNGGYKFSDTALSGCEDLKNNLTLNNLWVIYGKYYDGNRDNTFLETVAGDKFAKKLNDYKEDYSKEFDNDGFIRAKPYHNVLLTTKDLSVDDASGDDLTRVNVSTFPYDLSTYISTVDVGPLMEFTETSSWTAWYNIDSGNFDNAYPYNSGNCTKITDTPESINEELNADIVGKVYEGASDYEAYDIFHKGKTIIQLNADYKTFKIPVYDGLGRATNEVVPVTYGDTEYLIPDGKTAALKGFYTLVYEKDSENTSTSGWISDKADLWGAIEDVVTDYSEFKVSNAKLVRDVTYNVYESSNVGTDYQGQFTSLDLLNGVSNNAGKQYLDSHSASGDNIWEVESSYTDDVNAAIKEILTNSEAYTLSTLPIWQTLP